MSAVRSMNDRTQRYPLAAATTARTGRFSTFLLAVLLVLTLALAPRAEAFVYWANPGAGTIGRANLDGTGVDQGFITGPVNALGIEVDSAHVYWADGNGGSIGRANLDGTGVDQRFITGAGTPYGVAVDAAHVYWANLGVGPDTGTIGRANLDGTGVDQGFIIGVDPGGVAVDAAHVYWTDLNTFTIGRASLDGTGVDERFIDALFGAIAVDAQYIYSGVGPIGRANLDGTGVEQSFIETGLIGGVAVDAAHVYWTDDSGNTIGRANLDGTGVDPRFITGAQFGAGVAGVAVDALRSFSFGKVKKNKRKGTAKLGVKVPGPGRLKLAQTNEVKGATKRAEVEGSVKLPVKSRGNARKKLHRNGKAKVKAEVTYTPQGGDPTIIGNTDTTTVKLVKRG